MENIWYTSRFGVASNRNGLENLVPLQQEESPANCWQISGAGYSDETLSKGSALAKGIPITLPADTKGAESWLASGVLVLAAFAVKSGAILYDTIQEFRNHPRQVRELVTELAGLVSVLQKLTQTGDLSLDVDLTALKLTLEQCKRSCDEVRTELLTYCSRSRADRASFRDWFKLKCSGGDGIEGFRQQLVGYKSMITVTLSFANLHTSATTTEAIHACRDLIVTTTVDLEAHLEEIQQKLEVLCQRAAADPGPDESVRKHMEDEQQSTEKGLEFCAALSEAIEKIQVNFFGGRRGSLDIQRPDSTSGMLLGEGLDGCMHHMRFTLDQLEKHRKRIAESLSSGSESIMSKEDQSSLEKLQAEEKTVRHCLDYCMGIDEVLESQISNIENHAEGDDTIQFMVSTDGKTIHGKNRGVGLRLKQVGGHIGEESLQQLSQDFKTVSIHQTGTQEAVSKSSMPRAAHFSTISENKFIAKGKLERKPCATECSAKLVAAMAPPVDRLVQVETASQRQSNRRRVQTAKAQEGEQNDDGESTESEENVAEEIHVGGPTASVRPRTSIRIKQPQIAAKAPNDQPWQATLVSVIREMAEKNEARQNELIAMNRTTMEELTQIREQVKQLQEELKELREQLLSVKAVLEHQSPQLSYAEVARTLPTTNPSNIRTLSSGLTLPSTYTDTPFCTLDTSGMTEECPEKGNPAAVRTLVETVMRKKEGKEAWGCIAVKQKR
ncbi:hypothetical protein JX266_014212 [Neoarthrinium moseri]|nr:hypothetical protein JX266_014212 [Neoarthrinium moseri]